MTHSNSNTKKAASNVQCVEVLIAKSYMLNNGANLFWTLSVYSLENHPVKMSRDIHNSEIFRFMVYDWKRTIKGLLHTHKVPYSIVHYFTPVSIYADDLKDDMIFGDEFEVIRALDELYSNTSLAKHVSRAETSVTPQHK